MKEIKLSAPVSLGYGFGKLMPYEVYQAVIVENNTLDQITSLKLYQDAVQKAQNELDTIVHHLKEENDEKSEIFNAHIEILNDIEVNDMIVNFINEGYHPTKAVDVSYKTFKSMLDMIDDPYIKARVADLDDVKTRVLRNLDDKVYPDISKLEEDVIIVTYDLYPSDTATMDRTHVKGIITEIGSNTSHSAIIAKSYDIPAIIGVKDLLKLGLEGPAILDAVTGSVIVDYDLETKDKYLAKQQAFLQEKQDTLKYLNQSAKTLDGNDIEIHLNIGSNHDESLDSVNAVDGIGLFRSEFLFMENTHLPTFEEQVKVYEDVSVKFEGKKVTLRTLDIGGDKKLSYLTLPEEENPFLGKRALRLCFEHMDMFKTQIKAALVGSVKHNIQLMFPMVGSIDDIVRAKEVVLECKKELDLEDVAYDHDLKIGIMIEIPSIAMMSDEVCQLVDFASVGTNDLTQYLHAVDRMNTDIKSYYQSYSPAVFRVLKMISDSFNAHDKGLSICGELGGDEIAAPILIGLGIKKLSMSLSQVAKIKKIINTHEQKTFDDIAQKVLKAKTQEEVIEIVKNSL
ncbi:MAG: phosphoenolpyruvate--protein phosphotransferase [Acholeplasmataceae bacterium]